MRVSSLYPLALVALSATAQSADAQVSVHGRVLDDDTGAPVPTAAVIVTDPDGRSLQEAVSDSGGFFRFEPIDRRSVRLEVSRIGYEDITTSILYFDEFNFFRVEVRLASEAVLLAPLEVVARSLGSPVLAGFEDRRSSAASGWFFTREEIEALRPAMVSDVLARVPGVRLETSGRGTRRTVSMSRSAGLGRDGCPVQVYIDGSQLNASRGGEVAVDDLVSPQSVEGIEVYRGVSSVPAPFMNPQAHCGVVAIWTRRGGPSEPPGSGPP